MEQFIMKGGNPLVGEVTIGGAKNAALGILAASIMTDEDVVIENLPDVRAVSYTHLDVYKRQPFAHPFACRSAHGFVPV